MERQRIYVEKEYIQINNSKILANHWYKLILYIIRKELYDKEEYLIEVLGEDEFGIFYELIDEWSSKIESSCFDFREFESDFSEMGSQIKKSLLEKTDVKWRIGSRLCDIGFEQIYKSSISFFKNSILPFLQIRKEDEIDIVCSSSSVKKIYESLLTEHGYISLYREKKIISSIHFIQRNSDLIEWLEQNFVIVKNDLLGRIPVDLKITTYDGRQIEQQMNIFFPFYQKGDCINITIEEQESKWILQAENETKKLQYRNEISI